MQQIVSQRRGFTLIELMIVVAVVCILASIAYPSFKSQVLRSRRADAMAVLTTVVQAQERYRANRSAFTTSPTDLLGANANQTATYYDISISALPDDPSLTTGYVVTATPRVGTPQVNDAACETLSIEIKGAAINYLATGAESTRCWAR